MFQFEKRRRVCTFLRLALFTGSPLVQYLGFDQPNSRGISSRRGRDRNRPWTEDDESSGRLRLGLSYVRHGVSLHDSPRALRLICFSVDIATRPVIRTASPSTTRSSAQGNCSAKSLVLRVPPWGVQQGEGGSGGKGGGLGGGGGRVGGGGGAGDISSTLPYTALPHGASP